MGIICGYTNPHNNPNNRYDKHGGPIIHITWLNIAISSNNIFYMSCYSLVLLHYLSNIVGNVCNTTSRHSQPPFSQHPMAQCEEVNVECSRLLLKWIVTIMICALLIWFYVIALESAQKSSHWPRLWHSNYLLWSIFPSFLCDCCCYCWKIVYQ